MKKVACILFVVCVLCSIFSVSYGEGGYLWMVDAGSGVNVRDAKKNGNVVGFLRRGEIIKVVEEDSRWVGFYMDNGNIGYVYKQYLHIAHAEEIEEWERKKKLGIKLENKDAYLVGTLKEDSKIYKTPNDKILGELEAGTTVFIRQTGKYWYKVIWNNKELGYVQTSKVKITAPNIPGEEPVRVVIPKNSAEKAPIWDSPFKNYRESFIKTGYFVRILEEDNDWCKVMYDADGNIGYMHKSWLKETKFFD